MRTSCAPSATASTFPSPTSTSRRRRSTARPTGAPRLEYLRARRAALGGSVPARKVWTVAARAAAEGDSSPSSSPAASREVSTTMGFVQILRQLLKDPEIGKRIVPIVPDEARTFGMESLFRQHGIYASKGQLYEPVDSKTLLFYKEVKDGQILEEGITEAGSMASFTAAGTAYATHGVDMIPFFIFYSMFGFQRIGDQIWAFGDQRGRGFLLGATAGRTTLNGEGLQHEDGHSHVLATTVPNLRGLRPRLRLRGRGHHRGRPAPDVPRARGRLLLPHALQRELPYAADARGRGPGHPQGALSLLAVATAGGTAAGAASRFRVDPRRGAARTGHSRGALRRRGGCLERDLLQGAAARGARVRALQPAASGRGAAGAVRHRACSAGRADRSSR